MVFLTQLGEPVAAIAAVQQRKGSRGAPCRGGPPPAPWMLAQTGPPLDALPPAGSAVAAEAAAAADGGETEWWGAPEEGPFEGEADGWSRLGGPPSSVFSFLGPEVTQQQSQQGPPSAPPCSSNSSSSSSSRRLSRWEEKAVEHYALLCAIEAALQQQRANIQQQLQQQKRQLRQLHRQQELQQLLRESSKGSSRRSPHEGAPGGEGRALTSPEGPPGGGLLTNADGMPLPSNRDALLLWQQQQQLLLRHCPSGRPRVAALGPPLGLGAPPCSVGGRGPLHSGIKRGSPTSAALKTLAPPAALLAEQLRLRKAKRRRGGRPRCGGPLQLLQDGSMSAEPLLIALEEEETKEALQGPSQGLLLSLYERELRHQLSLLSVSPKGVAATFHAARWPPPALADLQGPPGGPLQGPPVQDPASPQRQTQLVQQQRQQQWEQEHQEEDECTLHPARLLQGIRLLLHAALHGPDHQQQQQQHKNQQQQEQQKLPTLAAVLRAASVSVAAALPRTFGMSAAECLLRFMNVTPSQAALQRLQQQQREERQQQQQQLLLQQMRQLVPQRGREGHREVKQHQQQGQQQHQQQQQQQHLVPHALFSYGSPWPLGQQQQQQQDGHEAADVAALLLQHARAAIERFNSSNNNSSSSSSAAAAPGQGRDAAEAAEAEAGEASGCGLDFLAMAAYSDAPMPPFVLFQVYVQLQQQQQQQLRRGWTAAEDRLLLAAVAAVHAAPRGSGRWMDVAARMQGRTNNQCRARYNYLQVEAKRHGLFLPLEDLRLQLLVCCYGRGAWSHVARHMRSRTEMKCRERYEHCLAVGRKPQHWTVSEGALLRAAIQVFKEDWRRTAALFPTRSFEACKAHLAGMQEEARGIRAALLLLAAWSSSSSSSSSNVEIWLQQHLLHLYASIRCGLRASFWPSFDLMMSQQQLLQQQERLLQLEQLQQQQLLLLLDLSPRLVSLTAAGRSVCAANLALFHSHLEALQRVDRAAAAGVSPLLQQGDLETVCGFLLQQLQRAFSVSSLEYAVDLSRLAALKDLGEPSEAIVQGPLPPHGAPDDPVPSLSRLLQLYRHPTADPTLLRVPWLPTGVAGGQGPQQRRQTIGGPLDKAAGAAADAAAVQREIRAPKGRQKRQLPAPLLTAAFRSNVAAAALLRGAAAEGDTREVPMLAAAAAAAEQAAVFLAPAVWSASGDASAASAAAATAAAAAVGRASVASSPWGVGLGQPHAVNSPSAAAAAAKAAASTPQAASGDGAATSLAVDERLVQAFDQGGRQKPLRLAEEPQWPQRPAEVVRCSLQSGGPRGHRGRGPKKKVSSQGRGTSQRTEGLAADAVDAAHAAAGAACASDAGSMQETAISDSSGDEWVMPQRRRRRASLKGPRRGPGRPRKPRGTPSSTSMNPNSL